MLDDRVREIRQMRAYYQSEHRELRLVVCFFFFSSRRRHTRWNCDWSSDVCSSDLEADAVDRQVVLDVALDRQAGVAEVVSAAEARERPEVPGLAGERVQVDQPLVEPMPEGVPDWSGAPVRDLADDQGWQRGQLRAGGRGSRREERGRAHQVTPKCRAASTPERHPSSWNPHPW